MKKAVESIGWMSICNSENLEVTRAQFRYAYSAILERNLAETAASPGAAAMPTELLPPDDEARARIRDLCASAGTLTVVK